MILIWCIYTWRNSFLQRLLTIRCQEVRAVYILLSWRCSIYIVEMVSWRHFGVYLTSLPNRCVIHRAGKICIVGMFFSVIHSFMTVLNKFNRISSHLWTLRQKSLMVAYDKACILSPLLVVICKLLRKVFQFISFILPRGIWSCSHQIKRPLHSIA